MEKNHLFLPTINACLNTLATFFLVAGGIAIKQGKQSLHKKFMIAALISSTLFLGCYILNRILAGGITRYEGEGIWRIIYFFVLGTHTPLAMIILPFCFRAVWHAAHRNFQAHMAITRWLLPVWLYVSMTGVIIYFMLYIF